ncbi:hypothetical protein [Streptomyces sp. NPDC091294]|uniref:hypothetical protein n=1 Tax=Streptomyces sp. NPDC091294 TaxID=3365992 RepID=UPI0038024C8F
MPSGTRGRAQANSPRVVGVAEDTRQEVARIPDCAVRRPAGDGPGGTAVRADR